MKPAWPSSVGSSSSSSGKYGESIRTASPPRRIAVAVVCQIRLVTTSASVWTATARRPQATFSSFAASRRVLTSSVGFFWLPSSFCPRRLTQITGTFIFRHCSTSVS